MKLTRLEIQQLPGIDTGFTLNDLQPGVNFVTGPNTIGKSSLIRALRYLVAEPAAGDPAALALTAEFDNGGRWQVRRTGRGYQWTCDGVSTERPALPDRDALHCYWLTMENLVAAGDDDRRLVDQLRQALAGGYNLTALREGDFKPRPQFGQTEKRELDKARQGLRKIETDYNELQRQDAQLPELERQIELARQAGIEVENLRRALKLLEDIGEHRAIDAALAQFPVNMDRLDGRELATLEKLDQQVTELKQQQRDETARRQDAVNRLERTGLVAAHPTPPEMQRWRKVLDDARHQQARLHEKREQLDGARAARTQAMQALGGNGEPPRLQPEQIKQAEQLAGEIWGRQRDCQASEARLQSAGEAPDDQLIHRHVQAEQTLTSWLVADSHRATRRRNTAALIAAAGAALAVVAALLAQAWVALAAAAIAFGAALWSLRRPADNSADQARAAFEAQNLDGPADWECDAVNRALQTLRAETDRLRVRREKALAANSERESLDRLQQELAVLEKRKRALAEEIGFDPMLTALGVDHFVRQVENYQQAAQACQTLEATSHQLQGEIEQASSDLQQFLQQWHISAEADLASLESALTHLDERARRAEAEHQSIASADSDLQRLKTELDARSQEIAILYRDAGLQPGERQALQESCERLSDWRSQRERLRYNERRVAEHRQALATAPALVAQAQAGDRESLQRQLDDVTDIAGKLEEWLGERATITERVNAAGANLALEKAAAAVDSAHTALEERLDEQLFAEAGRYLLDEVESEHRSEHEPAVLRDARERFGRFTHHAWDIELHDGEMRARDLRQDLLKSLEELSSGTRMQLLLAVRLAWTRRLERGHVALPLFLDEALTTSDEKRFAVVAGSLVELAHSEDRQVFYLSARHHELDLWERVTGERPHHIDLAAVRGRAPEAAATDYELTIAPPLPEPRDKSPQAYAAELAVPPVAPRLTAGDIHLFHLLRDDLILLHHLMQHWHVTTLAQLQNLLQSPAGARAVDDPGRRQQLLGRCRTASTWIEVWRRGRGRPVDRIALEASGAVTDTFIGEVTALAERCGGDATRILEGLDNREVARFQAQKINELREFFTNEGYISPEQPLAAEGRERTVLLEAGRDADPDEIRHVVAWLEATAPQDAAPVNAPAETL